MDPEDLKEVLWNTGVDLWALIETAIAVAAAEHRESSEGEETGSSSGSTHRSRAYAGTVTERWRHLCGNKKRASMGKRKRDAADFRPQLISLFSVCAMDSSLASPSIENPQSPPSLSSSLKSNEHLAAADGRLFFETLSAARLHLYSSSASPSSRVIYIDRFIPSRIRSNFVLFDIASPSGGDGGKECGSGAYAAILGQFSLGRILE